MVLHTPLEHIPLQLPACVFLSHSSVCSLFASAPKAQLWGYRKAGSFVLFIIRPLVPRIQQVDAQLSNSYLLLFKNCIFG